MRWAKTSYIYVLQGFMFSEKKWYNLIVFHASDFLKFNIASHCNQPYALLRLNVRFNNINEIYSNNKTGFYVNHLSSIENI